MPQFDTNTWSLSGPKTPTIKQEEFSPDLNKVPWYEHELPEPEVKPKNLQTPLTPVIGLGLSGISFPSPGAPKYVIVDGVPSIISSGGNPSLVGEPEFVGDLDVQGILTKPQRSGWMQCHPNRWYRSKHTRNTYTYDAPHCQLPKCRQCDKEVTPMRVVRKKKRPFSNQFWEVRCMTDGCTRKEEYNFYVMVERETNQRREAAKAAGLLFRVTNP